jgi:PII-like signaling protein
MVIEIVDTDDKIKAFLPTLDAMMASGLVTLEKVQVLQYGSQVDASKNLALWPDF